MDIHDKSVKTHFNTTDMDIEEVISFLEHIEKCDYCLEELLAEEMTEPCVKSPAYLTEQILKRASAPDIQASRAVHNTSHKMQLFYYGLRTATGVIVALFLLFTIQNIDFLSFSSYPIQKEQSPIMTEEQKNPFQIFPDITESIGSVIFRSSNALMKYIDDFPNKILHGGDSK